MAVAQETIPRPAMQRRERAFQQSSQQGSRERFGVVEEPEAGPSDRAHGEGSVVGDEA